MQTCGCGALVPHEDGPVHAYMQAAPACWRRYGELSVRLMALGPEVSQPSHVDCFAVQHPGGADRDRRQRASVAVHLVALCLRLERDVPAGQLTRLRRRTSSVVLPALGIGDWPLLPPPARHGDVTAATLHGIPDRDLGAALDGWPASAWAAWSHQHKTVRRWVDPLLAAW